MIKGFPIKAIDFINCPCGGSLILENKADKSEVVSGRVLCSNNSSHTYEIVEGILKLISDVKSLDGNIQSEIKARDSQAIGYDLKLASRFDKELPSTLNAIGSVKGKNVIEYGCGTGRITEYLLDAEFILATDFSYASLNILANKFKDNCNLALVQTEITSIKTREKAFDLAVSVQVFEHIPSTEMQNIFLSSVNNSLVDEGFIVLSAYHYDLRRKIKMKPQSGMHASGIFYHYFEKKELKKQINKFLNVKLIKTIDITWPLEVKLGLNKIFGGFLSRFGENIFIINKLGHLILIKAIKKPDFVHYKWGLLGKLFFVKHWFWFTNPRDIDGASMANFFSYENLDCDGFYKKEGLTTIIDLNKSNEEIYSNFRSNFIQKQIRRGERNGIVVKHDKSFKDFKNLYLKFRLKSKLPKDKLGPMKNIGEFFTAYYEDQVIAGGLFIHNSKVMRAWALASHSGDDLSREVVGQANRMVLWSAIKYAKAIGCKEFDFGGISPDSPNKHLRTLAEFKEAFGGVRKKNFYYYKIYSPIIRFWMKIRGFKDI